MASTHAVARPRLASLAALAAAAAIVLTAFVSPALSAGATDLDPAAEPTAPAVAPAPSLEPETPEQSTEPEEEPGAEQSTEPVEPSAAPEVSASPAAEPEEEPGTEQDPEPEDTWRTLMAPTSIPAQAEVTVSRTTGLDPSYDVVTVTGTGFVENAPGTNGKFPPFANQFSGAYVVVGKFADDWRPSEGHPSSSRKVDNALQRWAIPAEACDANPYIDCAGNAQYLPMNPDGSFEVELVVRKNADIDALPGNWGIYTYSGSSANYAGFETYTPITFAAQPTPRITVDKTEQLDPSHDVITVTGTGFAPNPPATDGTRYPLKDQFSGAYVVFGHFNPEWRPSEGAANSTRRMVSQRWAIGPGTCASPAAPMVKCDADPQYVETDQYGNFTTTLVVRRDESKATEPGNWGVYTFAGSGAVYAPFETYTPVSFAAQPTPRIEVSKTADLDPSGETVTITGYGFSPTFPGSTSTRPPLAGHFGGAYVIFGKFADTWKPTEGATSSARAVATQRWAISEAGCAAISCTAEDGYLVVDALGNFQLEMTVAEAAELADADGNWGIYTYSGGGPKIAAFETYTPLAFAAESGGGDDDGTSGENPGENPVQNPVQNPGDNQGATPPSQQAVGSLTWAVSSSFNRYILDNADGSITRNGVSWNGSTFTWVQTGGTVDTAAGSGTATYGGSVTWKAHQDVLNVTFASPQVRLTSSTSAMLSVVANGSRIDLASVNLGAATRTEANGAVRYSGAPATLTAAGSVAFHGFYPVGEALSPVTVTFGAAGAVSGGVATTVSTAADTPSDLPPVPPVTTGIELDDDTLAALAAGELVTISVPGFTPGEEVRVIIYSVPNLLATVTADSAGVATWTGRIPAGYVGEHTLLFLGSIAKAVTFEVVQPITEGQCAADSATLSWGFKEGFRSYLDSTLANGTWELSDGVSFADGQFTWSEGSGTIGEGPVGDLAFTGSLTFDAHGGVLHTTLANPVMHLTDRGAFLLLDVLGDTQDGVHVDQTAVPFLELNLGAGAATVTDGVVTVSGVPSVLTAEGAAAFGTYPAGEQMDPVSFTITSDGCAEAVFGLGAGGEVSPTDAPTAEPTLASDAESDAGLPWLWIVVALIVVAGVAGGAGAAIATRAKKSARQ